MPVTEPTNVTIPVERVREALDQARQDRQLYDPVRDPTKEKYAYYYDGAIAALERILAMGVA